MMNIQEQFDEAFRLKAEGKNDEALNIYSAVLDELIKEAKEYSFSIPDCYEEVVSEGKKMLKALPKALDASRNYLKKDRIAAVASNNMAVIYAEAGKLDLAKDFFRQAIDLTPDDESYPEPKVALEQLEDFG